MAFKHRRCMNPSDGRRPAHGEIEVAVLGDRPPEASLPGEIVPGADFYTYEDKYLDDSAELRWWPLDRVPPLAWEHEDAFVRRLRHL